MTDDSENLLEPKTNRPPAEVGRAVVRLAREHGAVRVEPGDSPYDVRIYPADTDAEG